MQIDDLKEAWAAYGTKLERSLAIDERLLREVLLGRVRRTRAAYALGRALEVALGIALLAVAVPVLRAHLAEPRYLVAGSALVLVAAWVTALCAHLLVRALELDLTGPVTAIQRDLGRLRRTESHAFLWALLGGILVWLPAALVLFEALTGVAALARADLAWLAANLALGLAVLVVGRALAWRYLERPELGSRARRVLEALSGRGLRRAADHLAELARFEREEPPRP